MTAKDQARSRIAAAAEELLELSHACGHNIIAAAAIGAATGLAGVADPSLWRPSPSTLRPATTSASDS